MCDDRFCEAESVENWQNIKNGNLIIDISNEIKEVSKFLVAFTTGK